MKATNTFGLSEGLPTHYIEAFLEGLRTARYAEETLRKKRWVLSAFSRWMMNKNIAVECLDESAIALFLDRLGEPRAARSRFEHAVLLLFLAWLRDESIVRMPTARGESEIALFHGRYVDYLRHDRGLAKNSVLVYAPFIRDFLDSHDAGDGNLLPHAFNATTIREHLLARSTGRSGEYVRLMAVALRSFCHFLFLLGYTPRDLYDSVPAVSKCRQSSVPTFLTPEQEEALIATADRSKPCGRRDYAILLLLARLGLRAGGPEMRTGSLPQYNSIRIEHRGPLTWLVLNRPNKANALSNEMLDEFSDALRRMVHEGGPVIAIRGEGRGFSSGYDLGQVGKVSGSVDPVADRERLRRNLDRYLAMRDHPKPIIAAVPTWRRTNYLPLSSTLYQLIC